MLEEGLMRKHFHPDLTKQLTLYIFLLLRLIAACIDSLVHILSYRYRF